MKTRRAIQWPTCGLILGATALWACGPGFPNWLLDGTEETLLRSPRLVFKRELEMINILPPSTFRAIVTTNTHPVESAQADLADLDRALRRSGLSDLERVRIVGGYEGERNRLEQLRSQVEDWREWQANGQVQRAAQWVHPVVPDGLPAEFAGYFLGAIEFTSGRTNEARHQWEQVLALPAPERPFRSTWAAYMLGKIDVDGDTPAAITRFRSVRDLARAGFSDSLGLAASSLGWEARAALRNQDFTRAIDLYLEQASAGDPDPTSLRTVAAEAMQQDDATLIWYAGYPAARRVITAALLASHEDHPYSVEHTEWVRNRKRRWLAALGGAGVREPEAADRFALLAYQAGEFEQAAGWLGLASPESLAALWLKAKLRMREGDLDAAATLLAQATRRLSALEQHPAQRPRQLLEGLQLSGDSGPQRLPGELGVLRLQRREYSEALDLLLRAGYHADAAFVADRVLTLAELRAYVDRNWPAADEEHTQAGEASSDTPRLAGVRSDIRHWLACRLTRADRFPEARAYLPPSLRDSFDELVEHLGAADDQSLRADARANAFWRAARITRYQGIKLFGTALEPDWQMWDGRFESGGPSIASRSNSPEASRLHPTPEESERTRVSAPDPDRRFHYRHRAANLAWKAAKLMPDQSDETARVLCEAGGWIKARDPEAADAFYKALVIRCGHTELGTAADRKRWFPRLDEAGRLAEPMPPPVVSTYSGAWPSD